MKVTTISAAFALLTQVYGQPVANKLEARQFQVSIVFNGADSDASFVQQFPADDSQVAISKFHSK